MTATDGPMFLAAKNRAKVAVRTQSGSETIATLIAWRPRRHGDLSRRQQARVEFTSGRRACLPLGDILRVIEPEATS